MAPATAPPLGSSMASIIWALSAIPRRCRSSPTMSPQPPGGRDDRTVHKSRDNAVGENHAGIADTLVVQDFRLGAGCRRRRGAGADGDDRNPIGCAAGASFHLG